MSSQLECLLDDVECFTARDADEKQRAARGAEWLSAAPPETWDALLERLREMSPETLADADPLLALCFHSLANKVREGMELPTPRSHSITLLYRTLGRDSRARSELLRGLAWGAADALEALVALLISDPPEDSNQVVIAFSPLFQRATAEMRRLFPRLLDALAHLSVAAPILDLANYIARSESSSEHPAGERAEHLSRLLGQLTQQLEKLQEQGGQSTTAAVQATIDESVALAIALCDALGLIGDPAWVGKLYQALDLPHRRIRTEAAAALARLGEKAGGEALVEMAAEHSVRRFAVTFADELGLLDRVAEEHRTPQAMAISDLAVWLSQPAQLGLPPLECELIDHRQQFWPGYDDQVDCFLIRFCYRVGEGEYANIGIAGPLSHALADDLTALPIDDVYAAFAGWDAEHEDIFEIPCDALNEPQLRYADKLEARLRSSGYDAIQPLMLGSFFGTSALVARATKDGRSAIAVVGDDEIFSRPVAEDTSRPLSPEVVYQIYKGRQLLRTFN